MDTQHEPDDRLDEAFPAPSPLSPLSLASLAWRQPSVMERRYELNYNFGNLGWLAFTSAWRETAEAEIGMQGWKFDRVGFFRRKVLIWHKGEAEPFATYQPHTWRPGGWLELPDGASYELNSNFWSSRFELRTADERVLLTFHKSGWFRTSVEIEVDPTAARLTELPLLVAFGMYAILLHQHDSAAAGAVVATSS